MVFARQPAIACHSACRRLSRLSRLPPLIHTAAFDIMSSSNGAAEAHEHEQNGASSPPPPAASYEPPIYQPPHPDDRDGSGGDGKKKKKKSATTKSGTKLTKTAKGKTEDTAKGKEDDDGSHRCANCDKPDAKSKCGRCGVEWYCGRECQKVRGRSLLEGSLGHRAAPTRPSTPAAKSSQLRP